MKKEDYQPPSNPEMRKRIAALYRDFGLCPPWERSEDQLAREEVVWQEILKRWEKPSAETN